MLHDINPKMGRQVPMSTVRVLFQKSRAIVGNGNTTSSFTWAGNTTGARLVLRSFRLQRWRVIWLPAKRQNQMDLMVPFCVRIVELNARTSSRSNHTSSMCMSSASASIVAKSSGPLNSWRCIQRQSTKVYRGSGRVAIVIKSSTWKTSLTGNNIVYECVC